MEMKISAEDMVRIVNAGIDKLSSTGKVVGEFSGKRVEKVTRTRSGKFVLTFQEQKKK